MLSNEMEHGDIHLVYQPTVLANPLGYVFEMKLKSFDA